MDQIVAITIEDISNPKRKNRKEKKKKILPHLPLIYTGLYTGYSMMMINDDRLNHRRLGGIILCQPPASFLQAGLTGLARN